MTDKYKLNPFTGELDNVGLDQTTADGLYVKKAGDTMTGDLEFDTPLIGVILKSQSSSSIVAGNPIGLLLALTYSSSMGAIKRWRVTVDDTGALVTTEL